MNSLITGLVAAMSLAAAPCAYAQQSNENQQPQHVQPGAAGVSKPGVAGQPGNKSGPTATPSGRAQDNNDQQAQTRQQDQSDVQSKPDTESGRSPKNKSQDVH